VFGGHFTSPAGNPDLPAQRELAYRKRVVETALRALTTDVHGPTVFTVDEEREA